LKQYLSQQGERGNFKKLRVIVVALMAASDNNYLSQRASLSTFSSRPDILRPSRSPAKLMKIPRGRNFSGICFCSIF
jgi:hypothetical protein